MYICIARIRKNTASANNKQTGGFHIPLKLVWANSWSLDCADYQVVNSRL